MIHPLVVVPDHEGRLMCSDMTCATDKRSVEGGCFVSTTQCSDVSLIMELDYFVDVCVCHVMCTGFCCRYCPIISTDNEASVRYGFDAFTPSSVCEGLSYVCIFASV